MPNNTGPSGLIRQRLPRALHRFAYSKVLVVARQDLDRLPADILEHDKMLDDIQQALFRKHAIKRNRKEVRCIFLWLLAVLRLP